MSAASTLCMRPGVVSLGIVTQARMVPGAEGSSCGTLIKTPSTVFTEPILAGLGTPTIAHSMRGGWVAAGAAGGENAT